MIAVRKQHKAFRPRRRSTFLYPRNRKILAYLREHERRDGFCASPTCRAQAQAVELDLSRSRDRVPVELTGGPPFPPIGELPYLLTLPAYGFFWFLLAEEADAPALARAGAGAAARIRHPDRAPAAV